MPEVRLIGAEGEQLGVISTREALRMSDEEGLDLVEVSPDAKPPVCRIMDFGKYRFEINKRKAMAKKKQKISETKEIKFRPTTEEQDYQVKLRNIKRFLEEGDKVRVSVRFRGRESSHPEIGMSLFAKLQQDLVDISVVDQMPRMEGRQIVGLFSPKKKSG